MAEPADDNPNLPAPGPDELRELHDWLEGIRQKGRQPNTEEMRELHMRLRRMGCLLPKGKPALGLSASKTSIWPKPQTFPPVPPGSEVPLRDDPK